MWQFCMINERHRHHHCHGHHRSSRSVVGGPAAAQLPPLLPAATLAAAAGAAAGARGQPTEGGSATNLAEPHYISATVTSGGSWCACSMPTTSLNSARLSGVRKSRQAAHWLHVPNSQKSW